MNYQEAKQRISRYNWNNDVPNWLVKEISLSTEMSNSEKIDVLESSGGAIHIDRTGLAYTSLRESLYNIIDMLNRDSEVVATERKLADYSNLISQRLVYVDSKKVIGIVNDSELGDIEIAKKLRYIKLSPLGVKNAQGLAKRGRQLATQQLARLERLRIA